MVTFLLQRHGTSLGNQYRIVLGHTDLDLAEAGRAEAEAAAAWLKDCPLDAIYSSPVMRAYHTALPHLQYRPGMEVHKDEGLMEIYLGFWEGMEVSRIEQLDAEGRAVFNTQFGLARPGGGEAVTEAAVRFEEALRRIGERHEGQTVLVAAHAAVIRSFYSRISHHPPQAWNDAFAFPANASITTVTYEAGVFTPIAYSQTPNGKERFTKEGV